MKGLNVEIEFRRVMIRLLEEGCYEMVELMLQCWRELDSK